MNRAAKLVHLAKERLKVQEKYDDFGVEQTSPLSDELGLVLDEEANNGKQLSDGSKTDRVMDDVDEINNSEISMDSSTITSEQIRVADEAENILFGTSITTEHYVLDVHDACSTKNNDDQEEVTSTENYNGGIFLSNADECTPDKTTFEDYNVITMPPDYGIDESSVHFTPLTQERVIERRLRHETVISKEQFGFMPGRGTTDAIFALRQLVEKARETRFELHLAFVDLERAYDRESRQELWRSMRGRFVPEKYILLVGDMNRGAITQVRTSVGRTHEFQVRFSLHQGSALSPYLFELIIDVIGSETKRPAPWCMLFAEDIVLC
ncbi:uncharacterized protein LOC111056512 [Nilaparvata lugens]|uniref:uncharacterized protein LOC111056512 n=1 Tax=Nilaparvata lugens TaxID=108931 RepID=UPI00193E4CB4|nr:uncharacterized protein LOC111056512 [Nilaparvata lugens]